MKILILEDEIRVANQLRKMVSSILVDKSISIILFSELKDAESYMVTSTIDLLLLDLNLNGEDGFEILKKFSAEPFHTIIISAYKDKALKAFEYGVLDFISKPFTTDRFKRALSRLDQNEEAKNPTKYLVIKKSVSNLIIDIKDVLYLEAQGHHTVICSKRGKEIHHKSLNKLLKLLPANFERVHKSFIVNTKYMKYINSYEGSKNDLVIVNGDKLPIGRKFYKYFKQNFV